MSGANMRLYTAFLRIRVKKMLPEVLDRTLLKLLHVVENLDRGDHQT